MNLSLEADLLPKTHAGGGAADIVYLYEKNEDYPKHTLLIEVTLSEGTNQKIMEMEPVSRHIGEYCLKNKGEQAYCIFVSPKLLLNLVSDFRARKNIPYFSSDEKEYINGTKIIPLKTLEIRTILEKNMEYSELYKMFEKAFNSNVFVRDWYGSQIQGEVNK